jgi:hypothetical protein
MPITSITSISEMRSYIKRRLGYPVINVEIHDDQLTDIISDSMDIFSRYHYGEGSYLDYLIFTISADTNSYNLSAYVDSDGQPLNINDIVDFETSISSDGINTLFTPSHVLLQEQSNFQSLYSGYYSESGGQMQIASLDIAQMYIEELKSKYSKKYTVNYIPGKDVLKIVPTPTENATGVLQVYRRQLAQSLWNNELVKDLCSAKAMILWGRILTKFNINLPGGGTINGTEIKQEGQDLLEKTLENIRLESEPPDFYVE